MFKKGFLLGMILFCALAQGFNAMPPQKKSLHVQTPAKKVGTHHTKISKPTKKSSKSKGKKYSKAKSKKFTQSKYKKTSTVTIKKVDTVRQKTLQIIGLNKEKNRLNDSIHTSMIHQQVHGENGAKKEEGYFAALFSDQKKSASFQTLDGTASVFKSISGWQDKKFYILTNEIPIGTIVKITTSDFKTICAKVINALPEVSHSIQYRLSDAAAAILGITNKTFQISVTY